MRRRGLRLCRLERGFVITAMLFASVLGCPAQTATKPAPATRTPAKVNANVAKDPATAPSADAAWLGVLEAGEPPDLPRDWEDAKLTPKQIAEFRRKNGEAAARGADQARDFYTRFADQPKALEARVQEFRNLAVAVHFGLTNLVSRRDTALQDL